MNYPYQDQARSGRVTSFVIVGLSIAIVTAALTDAADARRYRPVYEDGEVITAYSKHGNGHVSGPVRRARYGWEVRLPGGTWVGCRTNCEETLRVQTVDIFENDGRVVGYGSMDNECGVFGCLELVWPRW